MLRAASNRFTNLNFYTLLQFIVDVTITISKAKYGDCRRLQQILMPYNYDETRSSYKVRGTFKELENLVESLKSAEHCYAPTTRGPARQTSQRASTQTPLTVSALVMNYIQLKRAEKLRQIQGERLIIETEDNLKAKHQTTVQVTFRSRSEPSHPPDSVRADFARQRFVTFYQRTASDLQVTALSLKPHDLKDLQRQFPLLLFKPSSGKEVTVIGPFANVHSLEAFLSQNSPKLSNSPVKGVSQSSASRKVSRPSSKHSQQDEVESCPICMDPIRAGQITTLKCNHSFCRSCLSKAFDYKPVCPICGEVYGVLKGLQPEGGEMKSSTTSSSLPGYEECGTITIHYHIPSGIQKVRAQL